MRHEFMFNFSSCQIFRIKENLLGDVRRYLQVHQKEVLEFVKSSMIDGQTKISGEFFDDFLGDRISFYTPTDLKDIFGLCLEEPMIVADLARFTSAEPTTLMIIKDAIRFYFKDCVYKKMPELVGGLGLR